MHHVHLVPTERRHNTCAHADGTRGDLADLSGTGALDSYPQHKTQIWEC